MPILCGSAGDGRQALSARTPRRETLLGSCPGSALRRRRAWPELADSAWCRERVAAESLALCALPGACIGPACDQWPLMRLLLAPRALFSGTFPSRLRQSNCGPDFIDPSGRRPFTTPSRPRQLNMNLD